MTQIGQKVLADALALDKDDRAMIAARLRETLDDEPTDPGHEEAWAAEIQRRADQLDRGEVKGVPLEEAMKMIGKGRGNEAP